MLSVACAKGSGGEYLQGLFAHFVRGSASLFFPSMPVLQRFGVSWHNSVLPAPGGEGMNEFFGR